MKNNKTKQNNVVGELLKQGVTDVVAKELAQTYLDNVKLESVSYLRLSRFCVFFENDGLRAKMRRGLGFITNPWYKWVLKK